jgi:signal transduction histidine kinase
MPQPLKVLLVEDNIDDAKMVLRELKRAGFEATPQRVDTEPAFLDSLRVGLDLILSDYVMPQFSGMRALELSRSSGLEIPFILVSGTIGEEIAVEAIKLGATDYLLKDRLARLGPAVRRALQEMEEKNQRRHMQRQFIEALKHANRELESRVQSRTAELQFANQELESFAYTVSHDLRAPLRHISGFIDIVLGSQASPLHEADRKHLQTAKASARKMGELIEALLELSMVTRAELNRRPVNLTRLADEVMTELMESDPSRTVQWTAHPDMEAFGDQRLLRIALANLLGNAWKYTQKRAHPQIEFGKMTLEGNETYFVRDNGAGFDMDRAGKLFIAFQRLHKRAEFDGTGIGLATVQRIIRRHEGRIWAGAILDRGATFYFTLGEAAPSNAQPTPDVRNETPPPHPAP